MKIGLLLVLLMICMAPSGVLAASDRFPLYENAPDYTTYFADGTPNRTYYCSPTGSNSTGDGSLQRPWFDLRGGAGVIQAGDLVLFRGGRYTGIRNDRSWCSLNRLTTSGRATDRIVMKNYPGETPVFEGLDDFSMTLYAYQVIDGLTFQGGISVYSPNVVIQNCEFSYGTAGQQDGNPAMIVFPAESPYASNVVIRNNSFHDSRGDHLNGNGRCYALCMFESNLSGGYTRILFNRFYNFNGATSQRFIVYCKDSAHGLEIAYNRFYNSNAFALGAWGQGDDNVTGYQVHHNLVYNCDGLGYYWGEAFQAKWHSNIVIDNGYSRVAYAHSTAGESFGFSAESNDHPSAQPWGEVYDNCFYVDVPSEWRYAGDSTGYWTWVDYNAFPSTAIRDRFQNQNRATANWQQHSVITANQITVDSNYFATLPDNSPLRGKGRYGGTIGGFTFGSGADTVPPQPPTGLSTTVP
ncbi:MAG: right-handed parallel beta-helix repeat-containing protein [bacterium]